MLRHCRVAGKLKKPMPWNRADGVKALLNRKAMMRRRTGKKDAPSRRFS
jgi:hypothetical protein